MISFENPRFCKQAEYDYFEEERMDLETLEVNGLYVAMYALQRKVANSEAFTVPIMIAELDEMRIRFCLVVDDETYTQDTHPMRNIGSNYVKLDTPIVTSAGIGSDKGYLREHREGLDGPVPQTNISEAIPKEDKTLVGSATVH